MLDAQRAHLVPAATRVLRASICRVSRSSHVALKNNVTVWCRFTFPPALSADAGSAAQEDGGASVTLRTNGQLQARVLDRINSFSVLIRAMQGATLTWNHCSVIYTNKWDASYLCALFKVRLQLFRSDSQTKCVIFSLSSRAHPSSSKSTTETSLKQPLRAVLAVQALRNGAGSSSPSDFFLHVDFLSPPPPTLLFPQPRKC